MTTPIVRSDRLVGREPETEVLRQRIAGGAGVTLICGEPGIGKTRFLREAERIASESTTIVLKGGATEAEGMPPYLPFLEAIGDFIRDATARDLLNIGERSLVALATLFPELHGRLDLPPIAAVPNPDQARLRLFEAVVEFFRAVSKEQRVVLVLDDLQWADTATIDLLLHLVRRMQVTTMSIIGAYRESEVDANPALKRGIAELNRQRSLVTIRLQRIGIADLAKLISFALEGPSSQQLVRELFEQSEGNPFFAEELLRGWAERGLLSLVGGEWRLTGKPSGVISITEAVRQRLVSLSEDTRGLLQSAAVVGRTFELQILASVSGQDEELIESALQLPIRLGLLEYNEDETYTFAHDKIRETLYLEVTPIRRKRLHGYVGHALEQRDSRDTASLAALAFHFGNSGDRDRGSSFAVQAMRAARDSYAWQEAVTYGETALSLTDESSPGFGDLLGLLAETCLPNGDAIGAVTYFSRASDWYLKRNDPHRAAKMLRGKANALWRLESIPDSADAFSAALHLIDDDRDPEAIAMLAELGTLMATSQLRSMEGVHHAERALAAARGISRPDLEAIASRTIGNILVRSNQVEEGLPFLQRALDIASLLNDPVEAAECCSCLLIASYWGGDVDGINAFGRKQIEFAEQSHDLFQMRHTRCWLAASAFVSGDREAAAALLNEQQALVEALGLPEPVAYLGTVRGMLLGWGGNIDEAEAFLQRGIEAYRQLNPSALIWHLGQYVNVLHQLGRRTEAKILRDELEEMLLACPPESPVIPEAVTTIVPMAIDERDLRRLEKYRNQLLPFSGRLANHLIDRMLGMIELAAGNLDEADIYLVTAESAARDRKFILELGHVLAVRAQLELKRGGSGAQIRARSLNEEAISTFESGGFPMLASRIRLTLEAAAPARARNVAGLSRREVDILRLLASGKSNREIAAALFLSEKTVANHVTAVFTKTGTNNRVEAAAFAIRNQLHEP